MRSILAALVFFAAATCAMGQTPREVSECYPDALRFCHVSSKRHVATFAEKLRVGACLLTNLGHLSPACRAVFAAHGV
jgi:hypothetical protein